VRKKHPKKDGLNLKPRLAISAGGLLIALYGFGMWHGGIAVYKNQYGQTVYSPGAIAIGIVVAVLAFTPPPSLLKKLAFWNRGKKS
jgi:hypothetical protein